MSSREQEAISKQAVENFLSKGVYPFVTADRTTEEYSDILLEVLTTPDGQSGATYTGLIDAITKLKELGYSDEDIMILAKRKFLEDKKALERLNELDANELENSSIGLESCTTLDGVVAVLESQDGKTIKSTRGEQSIPEIIDFIRRIQNGEDIFPNVFTRSFGIRAAVERLKSNAELESTKQLHIIDDFDDVLSAIAKIEGQDWLDSQERQSKSNPPSATNVYTVRDSFQAGNDSQRIIYGTGGWNRYAVDFDTGRVRILEHQIPRHKKEETIALAKKLGLWEQ